MFSQKLHNAILEKNSRLCVGLDPRLEKLPQTLLKEAVSEKGKSAAAAAAAILTFNTEVITAVAEHAACIKPQIAFYERYGAAGVDVFWKTVELAQSQGLPVIADIKRSDIGSTAQAYADAYLGGDELFDQIRQTEIDAVTINPFMGMDTLEPWITTAQAQDKGVFVLVKTSNPGSGDLQDLQVKNQSISTILATRLTQLISDQNYPVDEHGYSSVGVVVGATYPESAQELRAILAHSIFLVPGIGAQGGDPTLLRDFFDSSGLGAIVNSSRGVTFPFEPNDPDYLTKITQAAQDTKELINQQLQ